MSYDIVQSVIHNAIFGDGSSGSSGSSFDESITQVAHGFSQNDVIAHNGTIFVKADVSTKDIVLGIITSVSSADAFKLGKMGYVQNASLATLLATVDSDDILYLGLNGTLVPKSDVSISLLNKIPVLKKIESDKGEMLLSTQYLGFKNDSSVYRAYFLDEGNGEVQEGNWKIELDNPLLRYYRYEGGIWVLKTTLGASLITDSFVLEDSSGQLAFERPSDGGRQTLVKPSIDGFGAVLGNPDGRVGFVSRGEHTLAYPKTANAVWVTDNVGVGLYTPMADYYEEPNIISQDQIMYKIRIYASTGAYKFRFAMLNAADNSILLQNVTPSEYDLEVGITPLVVGENTIDLKYPIAFTKGLNIKIAIWTPTYSSYEVGSNNMTANSIYRKFAELGTMAYNKKWREGEDYIEDDVVGIEANDTGYNLNAIGKYRATEDHTASGSFDNDLIAGKWEKISEAGYTDAQIKVKYENNVNTNEYSDAEKAKLASITGGRYLGVFADLTALQTAYPTGNLGDTATVTSPDNTLYYWNGAAWTDTGLNSAGDMLKSVYDPTNKATNAFNMDNMDESTNSKILTLTERNKLISVESNAEVNNISDIYATSLTNMGDTTIHYHSDDRARANHTGTQTASTISDFDTEVSNNASVVANTAKVSNATHTGDVTGGTELTISSKAVEIPMLTDGVSGEIITWNNTGVATTVSTGNSNEILASNGAGNEPSFKTLSTLDILKGSNNLSELADDSIARTNLNVDIAGTDNSTNVSLGGVPNDTTDETLNLTGQVLTVNQVTQTTDGAMISDDKLKLDNMSGNGSGDSWVSGLAITKNSPENQTVNYTSGTYLINGYVNTIATGGNYDLENGYLGVNHYTGLTAYQHAYIGIYVDTDNVIKSASGGAADSGDIPSTPIIPVDSVCLAIIEIKVDVSSIPRNITQKEIQDCRTSIEFATDEYVKISPNDISSGHLSDKLSNNGNVSFTIENPSGYEKIKADLSMSIGGGYFQGPVNTTCALSTNWYKVNSIYTPQAQENFTWDAIGNRWVFNGASGTGFTMIATFTGSHGSANTTRIVDWEFRVNGLQLSNPYKTATILKATDVSMSMLIPYVILNTNDYVEIYCRIDLNGEDVITSKMNLVIKQ